MMLETVRTHIGNIEVVQVIEMDVGHHFNWFLPDNTPENIRQIPWLKAPYRNEDYTLNGLSQSFVVKTGNRILVVDTCIGNDKTVAEIEEWNELHTDFLQRLRKAGIDPQDITDVLCTHLHVDHVGWNTYWEDGKWLPTFPNARYHFARGEYDHWLKSREQDPQGNMQSVSFQESIIPVIDAGLANFIDAPADLGDGIRVIPTPGHTHAHVSVVIDAGTRQVIIAGDAIHHPCQIARPEWGTVADHDQQQAVVTRNALLGAIAETPDLIAGIHFNVPSFGQIETDPNGGYVFLPQGDEPDA